MQMHLSPFTCIKSTHQIIALHEHIIMPGKKEKEKE